MIDHEEGSNGVMEMAAAPLLAEESVPPQGAKAKFAGDLGAGERTGRIRAIVADDTPSFLHLCSAYLEVHTPAVEVVGKASNGALALFLAEELHPELILLDVNMPIMNGLEAASRLREKFSGLKILMMSGDDNPDLREACFDNGADAFAAKGNLRQELPARLQQLFPSLQIP